MTVERVFVRSDFTIFGICAVAVGLAAVTRYTGVSSVLAFVVAGAAVAALASLRRPQRRAITVIAVAFIVFDGESTWLEGATLIALYCIIGAVCWWG
ncbi:hypothetical protein ACQP1P_46125 [Dactylosporangium sp. CA-052675]|uniref:hypothetical protein n=1 Tax=Dactylosporangium sp. CA-052675 TaxID=3239927 RepID=UPI003D8F82C3